jgi:hypothetical protein
LSTRQGEISENEKGKLEYLLLGKPSKRALKTLMWDDKMGDFANSFIFFSSKTGTTNRFRFLGIFG